ncbi:hypothetical protein MAR_028974 [Mya arenaria]|uniref:Uncharacterized protein n=1 Tax=Mya arenaria TaxID=6604 RepID=A0ABY7DF20_MYAAR|nr:hypothetical protein MAR_028974 [Mya arenaria]
MKGYIFLFLVATAFCQATAQGTDGLTAKAAEETDEETDIDIKDENGNLVTQAEIFSDVKNDTSECYKEKPLTFEIPSSVWAFCEGREMTVLEAIECADKQGQERNFIDEIRGVDNRYIYDRAQNNLVLSVDVTVLLASP